ncbi:MAG: hypothetical protein AABZ12_07470 [Planctomycetota bacterium]
MDQRRDDSLVDIDLPTDTLTGTVAVKVVSESGSRHFKAHVNGVRRLNWVPPVGGPARHGDIRGAT